MAAYGGPDATSRFVAVALSVALLSTDSGKSIPNKCGCLVDDGNNLYLENGIWFVKIDRCGNF